MILRDAHEEGEMGREERKERGAALLRDGNDKDVSVAWMVGSRGKGTYPTLHKGSSTYVLLFHD